MKKVIGINTYEEKSYYLFCLHNFVFIINYGTLNCFLTNYRLRDIKAIQMSYTTS